MYTPIEWRVYQDSELIRQNRVQVVADQFQLDRRYFRHTSSQAISLSLSLDTQVDVVRRFVEAVETTWECPECEGSGYVDDPTACGDPDHCSPWATCGRCEGTGWS